MYFREKVYGTFIARLLTGISILLFINVKPGIAADCELVLSNGGSEPSFKLLAWQYPSGASFEDWVKRGSTQVTCKMLERLGVKPEIIHLPLRRAFAEMAAGNADMMGGSDLVFTDKAQCNIKMVPYRYYKISAYYFDKQKRSNEPVKLEDFRGSRMASPLSGQFEALTNIPVENITNSDIDSTIVLLQKGRIDYLLHTDSVEPVMKAFEKANQQGGGRFFEVSIPVSISYSGMMFNTNRPGVSEFADKFEAELARWQKEESFESYVKHDPSYLLDQAPESMLSELLGANNDRCRM